MMNIRRYGAGDARQTVVLQHGFVSGGEEFSGLSAHLARQYQVLATDLPGFAGSVGQVAADRIEEISKLLVESVSELGVDRFSLLGHSLGAMTALQVALDFPQRLEKLILYGGCPTGDLPHRFESFEATIQRIQDRGIDAVAADIASTWFRAGEHHPMYDFVRRIGAGADMQAAIGYVRAMAAWDVRHRLHQVRVPTLVICGDGDRSTHPDLSIEMWRGIPGAQLCIVPDSAHIAHLEFPELFNSAITRFLVSG